MKNKADLTVKKFNMLSSDKNNIVIVGLSGGADSVALTDYLNSRTDTTVIACHINHNLRGEESKRDENFVKEFCLKENIKLYIKSVDIKKYAEDNNLSEEEAGRKIRYNFFNEILKKENADVIATAHTLSDVTETMLFNLTRGASLKGLCSIPEKRDNIIRPLIECSRQDIENYINENNLSYVTDSTNLKPIYTRNKIRLNVIPVLKEINPNFENTVLRTVNNLKEDNELLNNMCDSLLKTSTIIANKEYNSLILKDSPISIKKRAAKKIIENFRGEVNDATIYNLIALIDKNKGQAEIGNNVSVKIFKDNLHILNKTDKKNNEIVFINNSDFLFNNQEYCVEILEKTKIIKKVYKNLLYLALDYDKIVGQLVGRTRREGDKIKLYNSSCTKTIKKLFIDKKLSEEEKNNMLLLCDDNGVKGIYSIGISDDVGVDENTKKVILIHKKQ